jgi:hypothetical protein
MRFLKEPSLEATDAKSCLFSSITNDGDLGFFVRLIYPFVRNPLIYLQYFTIKERAIPQKPACWDGSFSEALSAKQSPISSTFAVYYVLSLTITSFSKSFPFIFYPYTNIIWNFQRLLRIFLKFIIQYYQ